MSVAEKKLWACIQRKELGGYKFVRQHAIGIYSVDIACVSQKIIVELENTLPRTTEEKECDRQRVKYLSARGWAIVCYTNEDIYRSLDSVIDDIYAHLKSRKIKCKVETKS